MKHNVLFVLTHTGAELASLKEAIQTARPNVHLYLGSYQYQSYDDLQYLRSQPHNRKSAAAVWADVISDNAALSRFLLPFVDVIAYVSTTRHCEAVLSHSYGEKAQDYYTNRLMCIRQFVDRKGALVISEPGEQSPRLLKLATAFFSAEVLS